MTEILFARKDDLTAIFSVGVLSPNSLIYASSANTLAGTGPLLVGQVVVGQGMAHAPLNLTLSGDVTLNSLGVVTIGPGRVLSSMLANTAVTPGSYGDSTHVGQFTVNAQGQITAASSITIAELAGSALTEVNDTNVTLTLGGTPATSLLQPVSLTIGWTGQLAASRGGTGASSLGATLVVTSLTLGTVAGTGDVTWGQNSFVTTVARIGGVSVAGATGSGNVVFATSPTLFTPVLGVASATSINKVAITAPATSATLTIANLKTLTVNNSITFAGTDATTITFQATDTYVGRATTDTLTNKSISGATNTLTAIANASLSNSSVTIGSTAVSLGATVATFAGVTLTTPTINGAALTGTLSGTPAFSGANFITNANLVQAGAATIKGNSTASTANESAFTLSSLTALASPSPTLDLLLIFDHVAGTIKSVTPLAITSSSVAGVSSFNTLTGTVATKVVVQTFTTSGTYTPTAGMLHAIVELVGGGGGGGGATGSTTLLVTGGGGGSGAYSRGYVTAATIGASQVVTIGAGGTAGGIASNGGAGGATSVGTVTVAAGGSGGVFGSATNLPAGGVGGLGGLGTGDVRNHGNDGGPGFFNSGVATIAAFAASGYGGASQLGASPMGVITAATSNVNGIAGYGSSGSGGSGGASNNATGATGGAGGSGQVIITEYVNL